MTKDIPTAHITKHLIYLFSDQNTDKSLLYQFFQIQPLIQQNSMYLALVKIPKILSSNNKITSLISNNPQSKIDQVAQIYFFPDDRITKHQTQLYFNILDMPSLLLYFVNADSTIKQFVEWMDQIFQGFNQQSFKNHNNQSNNQKQQQFFSLKDETQNLSSFIYPKIAFISNAKTYSQRRHVINKLSPYFAKDIIDQTSLYTLLFNLGKHKIGIDLDQYIKRVSLGSKIKWAVKKFIQNRTKPSQSVI